MCLDRITLRSCCPLLRLKSRAQKRGLERLPNSNGATESRPRNRRASRSAAIHTVKRTLRTTRPPTVYLVRHELSQLRVEPLAGGYILAFTRPVGWTWVDGQTVDIPFQVVSNPLIIRRVLTPATPAVKGTGFGAKVKRQYQ